MPHIAITMLPGRDKAVKAKLALTVREAVSKELGIGAEYVSVSVEDVEKERWEESMRKIPAGGFQIVVYSRYARLLQLAELPLVQQAKGYADRNANRPFYFLHNPAHLLHLPIRQPFARCDDGITEYSPFLIALCLRNDLLFWQQRVLCGAGMVMRGLRAKPAIFRAAPALPVDNRADIKPVAAKMSPDSIRAFTQFVQWLLVKAHRFHLCDRFAA